MAASPAASRFAMLLFGGVSDKIGVRVSLALSLAVMMPAASWSPFPAPWPWARGMGSPMFFLMAFGLLLMVAAYGLYMPAAYAGVKRYTNPQTAAIGYAVIYGLMNLGAFFSGFVSSNARHAFAAKFPPNGLTAVFLDLFRHHPFRFAADPADHHPQGRPPGGRTGRPRNPGNEYCRAEPGRRRQGRRGRKKVEARVPMSAFYAWLVLALALVVLTAWTGLGLSYRILLYSAPSSIAVLRRRRLGILRRRPEHPFRDTPFVFFIFILIPVQTLFAHNWLTIPYYLPGLRRHDVWR